MGASVIAYFPGVTDEQLELQEGFRNDDEAWANWIAEREQEPAVLEALKKLGAEAICFAQAPLKKTDLTVADREAWHKVLRWLAELEEQWRRSRTTNDREQSGLAFYKLDQGNYLVAIEVHESAYQPRYLFMHYSDSGAARLLKLKTYEKDDDDAGTISRKISTEVEGVITFDAARKQLVFYTKGRGTGDCGSIVRYNITPTRAIPAEARAHACYDDYSLGVTDPARWVKIRRL